MKTIICLILLAVASIDTPPTEVSSADRPADVGRSLSVSLKYNPDFERYEVQALANFAEAHFLLGPSQISIVVPSQVTNQPLQVYSHAARWMDYSTIYAPSIAPDLDFHGVYSLGKSIEIEKDKPFVLFTFSLKGGYVEGVRLFSNGADPSSAQVGMKGGDFANTLQNHQSREFFRNGLSQAQLAESSLEGGDADQSLVSVYPNPITGDAVSVTVRRAIAGERLRLRLFSVTGVEFSSIEEDAGQLVDYKLRIPRQLVGAAYLSIERPGGASVERVACKKLIILD